jgi:hypothetical protein
MELCGSRLGVENLPSAKILSFLSLEKEAISLARLVKHPN